MREGNIPTEVVGRVARGGSIRSIVGNLREAGAGPHVREYGALFPPSRRMRSAARKPKICPGCDERQYNVGTSKVNGQAEAAGERQRAETVVSLSSNAEKITTMRGEVQTMW